MLDSVVGGSHSLDFGIDFDMDHYFYRVGEVQDSVVEDNLGIVVDLIRVDSHNCCKNNYHNIGSRNSVCLDNFSATDYNFVHSFESQNCDHLFVDFSVAVSFPCVNEKTHCYQIWRLWSC